MPSTRCAGWRRASTRRCSRRRGWGGRGAQTRKSTLPVTAHAAGLPRYPSDIEAGGVLLRARGAPERGQVRARHLRARPARAARRRAVVRGQRRRDRVRPAGSQPRLRAQGHRRTTGHRRRRARGRVPARRRHPHHSDGSPHQHRPPPPHLPHGSPRRYPHERGPAHREPRARVLAVARGASAVARGAPAAPSSPVRSGCGRRAWWRSSTLVLAYDLDFFGPLGGPFVLGFGAFAITGAMIAWNRPGHVLGLLFLVLGLRRWPTRSLAAALGPLAEAPDGAAHAARRAERRPDDRDPPAPAAVDRALPRRAAAVDAVAVGAVAHGRRQPARRRGGLSLRGAWGGDVDGQMILSAPFGGALLGVAEALSPLFFLTVPILIVSSAVAAVLRFRRGDAVTRQQMKWLALAALVLLMIVAGPLRHPGRGRHPAGCTPAIVMSRSAWRSSRSASGSPSLRHGLYDIDVVLNRTIVFVDPRGVHHRAVRRDGGGDRVADRGSRRTSPSRSARPRSSPSCSSRCAPVSSTGPTVRSTAAVRRPTRS
jgi:hypothetical protein